MADLDINVNDTMLAAAFKKKFSSLLSAKVVIDAVSRKSKGIVILNFRLWICEIQLLARSAKSSVFNEWVPDFEQVDQSEVQN